MLDFSRVSCDTTHVQVLTMPAIIKPAIRVSLVLHTEHNGQVSRNVLIIGAKPERKAA